MPSWHKQRNTFLLKVSNTKHIFFHLYYIDFKWAPCPIISGSLSHGMEPPQVAGGGRASNMVGSCKYI